MESFDEQQVTHAAWAFLRSNTTATLKFGEHTQDVKYVINAKGELVISAMVAMLQLRDVVMFVPEYVDDCMELQLTLRQFTEEGEGGVLADRWQVYHGDPPDVQWAAAEIDAARFHEMFVDGECLQRGNPLAGVEASTCKTLNANHTDKIKALCSTRAHVDVISPVVVGVDPLGLDVRATFGIVRIPSDSEFSSVKDVLNFVSRS